MQLRARFIVSVFVLIGSSFFAGIGAWLGPRLPWYLWVVMLIVVASLLMPWSRLIFSQEALQDEFKELELAFKELNELQPQLEELAGELEEGKILEQDALNDLIYRYQDLRRLTTPTARTLRELLFGAQRRAMVTQILMLLIVALGASLLVSSLIPFFQ